MAPSPTRYAEAVTTPGPLEPQPSVAKPDYLPYPALAAETPSPLPTPGYYPPNLDSMVRLWPDQSALPALPTSPPAVPAPIPSIQPSAPYPVSIPYDPEAPYGRDPLTGQPLSDKSKGMAGFLQFCFGWAGGGRFYIGDQRTGFLNIGLVLAAIFLTATTMWGWMLFPALGLWWLADFILILSGHVPDSQGRQLRSHGDGRPRAVLKKLPQPDTPRPEQRYIGGVE